MTDWNTVVERDEERVRVSAKVSANLHRYGDDKRGKSHNFPRIAVLQKRKSTNQTVSWRGVVRGGREATLTGMCTSSCPIIGQCQLQN